MSSDFHNVCTSESDDSAISLLGRERIWNRHKSASEHVAQHYAGSEYENYSRRIEACSSSLEFQAVSGSLKLSKAQFCRVRHCPICQWRRSLKWKAKAYAALPKIVQDFPKHRWLFLTLTIKNCPIESLRENLTEMHAAFKRMTKLDQWPVHGWIKSTEITRGQDGLSHPHFHVLLMVPPSYFSGKRYLSQVKWAQLWQQSLRIEYMPIIDIRAIKPTEDVAVLIPEILKYQTKVSDLLSDQAWMLELTNQMNGSRQISTGGILRNYMKPSPKHVLENDNGTLYTKNTSFRFDWSCVEHSYLYLE